MANQQKIRVLSAFRPYLDQLQAYNVDHFRNKPAALKVQQMCRAFAGAAGMAITPPLLFLASWHLIESSPNASEISTMTAIMLTYVQLFAIGVTILLKSRLIGQTIAETQRIVDEQCEDSLDLHIIFKRIEQIHQMLTRVMFSMLAMTGGVMFGVSLMFPVSYVLLGFPEPSRWHLLLRIHPLIEQGVYIGFLVNWAIELASILRNSLVVITTGSLYVGLCLYSGGMVAAVRAKMAVFHDSTDIRTKSTDVRSIYVKTLGCHVDIIGHAAAIQSIMNEILFFALSASTAITAFNLHALESNDLLSLESIVGLVMVVCYLPLNFGFCFLAEQTSANLYEIGDIFYDSPWYRLPAKHQRIVLFPIQRTGQVFRFRSLGLIDCSLATFLTLNRTACSYFVIIRRFK